MKMLLVLVLVMTSLCAEDVDLKELRKAGESERKELLAKLKEQRDKAEETQKSRKASGSRIGSGANPSDYDDDISTLEKGRGKYWPTLWMKEDSVGIFRMQSKEKTSITIDGQKCPVVVVESIIDETNMLVRRGDTRMWVSGVSTKNRVDDAKIGLPGLFRYAGTKEFQNVSGGKSTVYWIEKVGE